MDVITSRFGTISIDEKSIITIPEGLIGFSSFKRFVVYSRPNDLPFQWLQCVEDPTLAFVVVDPLVFCPDYQVEVKSEEISDLLLCDIREAGVLVLVVIPQDTQATRINLRAPLVINTKNNLAKQLILGDDYPLQYKVFESRSCA
jgi:flagellar assembly factor FliW